MKKRFKYFLFSLLAIFLLLIIGFFTPRKWSADKICEDDSATVIIGSNGYHTSYILPVKINAYDWSKDFPVEPGIKFIEFGWGNREFYMSRDFSLKSTLKAMFPSATVMHIVYLDKNPGEWFKNPRHKQINLCREEYQALVRHINDSFQTDSTEEKIYLDRGLYGPSEFYEGKGKYHAFQTCNTWVAEGLREAGVNTPLWAGTAQSIMWHLRKYNDNDE